MDHWFDRFRHKYRFALLILELRKRKNGERWHLNNAIQFIDDIKIFDCAHKNVRICRYLCSPLSHSDIYRSSLITIYINILCPVHFIEILAICVIASAYQVWLRLMNSFSWSLLFVFVLHRFIQIEFDETSAEWNPLQLKRKSQLFSPYKER